MLGMYVCLVHMRMNQSHITRNNYVRIYYLFTVTVQLYMRRLCMLRGLQINYLSICYLVTI